MDAAVLDGKTVFCTDEAHGASWLSMLDRNYSELLRRYPEWFIVEGYVPPQLLDPGRTMQCPDALPRYSGLRRGGLL